MKRFNGELYYSALLTAARKMLLLETAVGCGGWNLNADREGTRQIFLLMGFLRLTEYLNQS